MKVNSRKCHGSKGSSGGRAGCKERPKAEIIKHYLSYSLPPGATTETRRTQQTAAACRHLSVVSGSLKVTSYSTQTGRVFLLYWLHLPSTLCLICLFNVGDAITFKFFTCSKCVNIPQVN